MKKNDTTSETRHILIVDDDPEISESIRYALTADGYEVSVARDGNQGVAVLETKYPDLVILDMMMPKRSGFLVLERMRQNEMPPVPVIMITANDGQRHRQYAETMGISDYILKPFTMDRLLGSVENLLANSTVKKKRKRKTTS